MAKREGLIVYGKILSLSMISVLLAFQSVIAFKPDDAGHLGISEESLKATERRIDGQTLRFSDRAIKEILKANKDTDCPECQKNAALHFDDEAFGAGTTRLKNLGQSIINKIIPSSPDGASARKDLGGALHTLQDFYAHTTWIELDNHDIDPRLGKETFQGLPLKDATCPENPVKLGGKGFTKETSGWFKIPLCVPPPGKCRHGFPGVCPEGLNKDEEGREGYPEARRLAVKASKDFLNQILDASGVAGNAKAIKALMDVKGTLGIVIDDTGSMAGSINEVKVQVAQIVNSVKGTEKEPDEYLLVRFGDPDVGPPFRTGSATAFLNAVNNLFAHAGNIDCPEFSQSGLLQAIDASKNDSTLFLFTDASAKDAFLSSNVNFTARAKQITITPVLLGTCSPIDPVYRRNAQETGGQLFFLRRFELGAIFELVKPQLSGDFVSIMSARGTLSSSPQAFSIPIDSSITQVVFSVSSEEMLSNPTVSLVRPSGVPLAQGDPGVTITHLMSGGIIITVNAPDRGEWRLQMLGLGTFALSVYANSSLRLNSFQLVELTGRPAHEGLFPIAGQPPIGRAQTGLASLFGPFATAAFTLVAETGELIQEINLMSGDPDAATYEFVGVFTPPAQPFKVAVTGVDTQGLPYSRLLPTLFRAQPVEVSIDTTNVPDLLVGRTAKYSLVVHNLGPATDFQIRVTNNQGFVRRVNPTFVTLAMDASATVEVEVAVPAGTLRDTEVMVTATATSTSDVNLMNGATLTLLVAVLPGDVTLDGLLDCFDLLFVKATLGRRLGQPQFDPRTDTNGDGIINAKDLLFVAQQLPAGTRCP